MKNILSKYKKFNNGEPYHGSDTVMNGKLKGATDTDYFYFLCPQCPDQEMMEILEYGDHFENTKTKVDADKFALVFKIKCHKCKLVDFVKISNAGWLGGQLLANR